MREPRRYHHGDLRATLVDVAVALVAEQGPHGFSLAEASRRAGVSVAAPYRHFRTREDLLVAVGVRGYEGITARFSAGVAGRSRPADQLAAAAAGYVEWSAAEPAQFDVLFAAGIDKRNHPALLRAGQAAFAVLVAPARRLTRGGDEPAADDLATAVGVLAHGYATLLRDGHLTGATAVARQCAAAVRALVRGRRLLRPELGA